MATYTMQLRTLCESIGTEDNHTGIDAVDGIIERSWERVFGEGWDTYDPEYKKVLCRKILRHYWMKEIGAETPALFMFWLQTRMEEIMPYFNQLYKSAMIEFDPMKDYELTHTAKRVNDGTTDSENMSTTSATQERNASNEESSKNVTKFSDTPQGQLTHVEDGTYLTSATIADVTRNGETNETSIGSAESTNVGKVELRNTEDYTLHVIGKTGGRSYSKLLKEFRDTMLNIDMMIIERLSDLFMGLWA